MRPKIDEEKMANGGAARKKSPTKPQEISAYFSTIQERIAFAQIFFFPSDKDQSTMEIAAFPLPIWKSAFHSPFHRAWLDWRRYNLRKSNVFVCADVSESVARLRLTKGNKFSFFVAL